MAEWIQGATGLWILAEGDKRLKGPQSAPDDDGLPRVYSAGFIPDTPVNGTLERALELLSQIENDPARKGNGGPGLVGLGLGPNGDLFNGGSLDPCQWLEWLRDNFPGGMPGWLNCKNFKYLLLFLLFLILLPAASAATTVVVRR